MGNCSCKTAYICAHQIKEAPPCASMKAWKVGVGIILRNLQDSKARCQCRGSKRCLEQLSLTKQKVPDSVRQDVHCRANLKQSEKCMQLVQAAKERKQRFDCIAAVQESADNL